MNNVLTLLTTSGLVLLVKVQGIILKTTKTKLPHLLLHSLKIPFINLQKIKSQCVSVLCTQTYSPWFGVWPSPFTGMRARGYRCMGYWCSSQSVNKKVFVSSYNSSGVFLNIAIFPSFKFKTTFRTYYIPIKVFFITILVSLTFSIFQK